MSWKFSFAFAASLLAAGALYTVVLNNSGPSAALQDDVQVQFDDTRTAPATASKPPTLMTIDDALSQKGLKRGDPVFLRIVKSSRGTERDGWLEVFVQNASGEFVPVKRWDICKYSGKLGPKLKEGDGQSPEGFYFVKPGQMNPNSSYHLSFNLGFPNAYDRAHGRTGSFLMVHGDCVSIGCYAMTDGGIQEIYDLMEDAFDGGQPFVRVHIFPFPMTKPNMVRFSDHKDILFWQNLKAGWKAFETAKRPPDVSVSNKSYRFIVNQ